MAKAKARFKYTEEELKSRFVGVFIEREFSSVSREKSKVKMTCYQGEGVDTAYRALLMSFRQIFISQLKKKTPIVEKFMCEKSAQLVIDSFLLQRSRGEDVAMPSAVRSVTTVVVEEKQGMELYDASIWEGKENISENEKLRWVYEHMQVAGIQPEDAPSGGAFFMLMQVRADKSRQSDFYKTLWPKLLAKEEAETGGKLQDDGKATIELCDRLLEALPEKEA